MIYGFMGERLAEEEREVQWVMYFPTGVIMADV